MPSSPACLSGCTRPGATGHPGPVVPHPGRGGRLHPGRGGAVQPAPSCGSASRVDASNRTAHWLAWPFNDQQVAPSRSSSVAAVPRVLVHELLERGYGGGGWRERQDFVAQVERLVAVAGIAQHRAHGAADRRVGAVGWPDDTADAEG